jgi:putative membrane protein
MGKTVGLFAKGILIGLANIIPGVSGGTMALVLGIYDRMIRAIGRLGPRTVSSFVGAFRAKPRSEGLLAFAREHDLWFLTMLCVGAIAAVVATSRLMEFLLETRPEPTLGFFWGLIAASVLVPYAMVDRRSWREAVACVLAIVVTVGIAESMSREEKIAAAEKRCEMRAEAARQAGESGGDEAERPFDHSPVRLLQVAAAGAVAISAMVLPGISGSFIMLLLGMYFELLAAVNALDFVFLGIFAVGCVLGIVFFSRLISVLLDRLRSVTMAFLVGLILGSLWSIWPFKERRWIPEDVPREDAELLDLANRLPPEFGSNEIATVAAVAVGAAIVLGFLWWEKRRAAERAS